MQHRAGLAAGFSSAQAAGLERCGEGTCTIGAPRVAPEAQQFRLGCGQEQSCMALLGNLSSYAEKRDPHLWAAATTDANLAEGLSCAHQPHGWPAC